MFLKLQKDFIDYVFLNPIFKGLNAGEARTPPALKRPQIGRTIGGRGLVLDKAQQGEQNKHRGLKTFGNIREGKSSERKQMAAEEGTEKDVNMDKSSDVRCEMLHLRVRDLLELVKQLAPNNLQM